MKILRKILKWFGILLVGLLLLLAAADAIWVYWPQVQAHKAVSDLDQFAKKITDISLPEDTKIIALGEATHGNSDFQALKLDVLQTVVETEGVRSFALEMDFAEGMNLDAYIKGGDGNAQELVENLSFTIYQTEEMVALVDWMRDYNAQHPDDPLSFYAFDMQNPEQGVQSVIDYAKEHSLLPDQDVEGILSAIQTADYDYSDTSQQVALLTELKTAVDTDSQSQEAHLISQEITVLLQAFDYYEEMTGDYVTMNTLRDRYMADNVEWIQNFEESKGHEAIMISGHNGHVAKAERFYTNMGSQLANSYADSYFVIGTDYYHTTVNINAVGRDSGRSEQSFTSADPLAYQAKHFDGEYYLDFSTVENGGATAQLLEEPMNMGSLGEGYSFLMHFLPSNHRQKLVPKDLYDGMIFIYEAEPLNLLTQK